MIKKYEIGPLTALEEIGNIVYNDNLVVKWVEDQGFDRRDIPSEIYYQLFEAADSFRQWMDN